MTFRQIEERLDERKQNQLFRQPVLIQSYQQQYVEVAGHRYLNFSGNDYLGLAQTPQGASELATAALPMGSGGSPLVTGHCTEHQQLLDYICEHTGYEAALLCNSGFAANMAIMQTLLGPGDTIVADKLIHASLIDGASSSEANFKRFKHNNLAHLEQRLAAAEGNTLVVTEGVFSMDGDTAPLNEISELTQKYDAWLMVDDAHGLGVLGEHGWGTMEHHGMGPQQVNILMGTFGKAVGSGGAFIASSRTVIDYLTNFARHYVYSTAMSPLQAKVTLDNLKFLNTDSSNRDQLHQNIQLFVQLCSERGIPVLPSESAIQPILVGDPAKALLYSQVLKDNGLWVTAIRTPTVPSGTDRLRVTLSSMHQEVDIRLLVDALSAMEWP